MLRDFDRCPSVIEGGRRMLFSCFALFARVCAGDAKGMQGAEGMVWRVETESGQPLNGYTAARASVGFLDARNVTSVDTIVCGISRRVWRSASLLLYSRPLLALRCLGPVARRFIGVLIDLVCHPIDGVVKMHRGRVCSGVGKW